MRKSLACPQKPAEGQQGRSRASKGERGRGDGRQVGGQASRASGIDPRWALSWLPLPQATLPTKTLPGGAACVCRAGLPPEGSCLLECSSTRPALP